MNTTLNKLIELSQIDGTVAELRAKVEAHNADSDNIRKRHAREKEAMGQTKDSLKEGKMALDSINLEIKEKEGEIADTQGKQNQAKTNEEYSLLTKKVEELQSAISGLEDQALEAMEAMEQGSVDSKDREKELADKHASEAKDISENDAACQQLENEIAKATEHHKQLMETLDKDIADRYLRLRERYPANPVVPAPGGVCQGCAISQTQQDIAEMMQNIEIAFCRNCSRIIYLDD
jgi:uncharacterized protein